MTQYFKGDTTEKKMAAVFDGIDSVISESKDDFFENFQTSKPFILSLYDINAVPFTSLVPRDIYYDFIYELLERYPVTGTFDFYLAILLRIFGDRASIFFTVSSPGKLDIEVVGSSDIESELLFSEFNFDTFSSETGELITHAGDVMTAVGFPGISTQYQLNQIISQIIPAGISPTITLTFAGIYDFIADTSTGTHEMVDDDEIRIIFIELD